MLPSHPGVVDGSPVIVMSPSVLRQIAQTEQSDDPIQTVRHPTGRVRPVCQGIATAMRRTGPAKVSRSCFGPQSDWRRFQWRCGYSPLPSRGARRRRGLCLKRQPHQPGGTTRSGCGYSVRRLEINRAESIPRPLEWRRCPGAGNGERTHPRRSRNYRQGSPRRRQDRRRSPVRSPRSNLSHRSIGPLRLAPRYRSFTRLPQRLCRRPRRHSIGLWFPTRSR